MARLAPEPSLNTGAPQAIAEPLGMCWNITDGAFGFTWFYLFKTATARVLPTEHLACVVKR